MERPRFKPNPDGTKQEVSIPAQRSATGEVLTMASMPMGEDLRRRRVNIGEREYVRVGKNTIVSGDKAYRFNPDGTYTIMTVLSGWNIEGDVRDEDRCTLPIYPHNSEKASKKE